MTRGSPSLLRFKQPPALIRVTAAADVPAHGQFCRSCPPPASLFAVATGIFCAFCSPPVSGSAAAELRFSRAEQGRKEEEGVGGVALQKLKQEKSEKAVTGGLGTLVVSPLPLPDPPFQTRTRRLLRSGPGRFSITVHTRVCRHTAVHMCVQTHGRAHVCVQIHSRAHVCVQTHGRACRLARWEGARQAGLLPSSRSRTHTYRPPATKEVSFISCERRRRERGNLKAANSSATYLAPLSSSLLSYAACQLHVQEPRLPLPIQIGKAEQLYF